MRSTANVFLAFLLLAAAGSVCADDGPIDWNKAGVNTLRGCARIPFTGCCNWERYAIHDWVGCATIKVGDVLPFYPYGAANRTQ